MVDGYFCRPFFALMSTSKDPKASHDFDVAAACFEMTFTKRCFKHLFTPEYCSCAMSDACVNFYS